MKQRIAVTLDEELVAFLDNESSGNRSEYLNEIVSQYRKERIRAEMIEAIKQDVTDPEYQAELAMWDSTIGDGIDAEG
ncbi:MAG: hypothetical protein JOZ78_25410 [Chroococcidiopsidaceae cyanobacterium CP_BM_ER_R8_30]|nr:hypothetical protein [Chroococcidiopsidaceae cyanobacterium CP_BM_ER_R8_30]